MQYKGLFSVNTLNCCVPTKETRLQPEKNEKTAKKNLMPVVAFGVQILKMEV